MTTVIPQSLGQPGTGLPGSGAGSAVPPLDLSSSAKSAASSSATFGDFVVGGGSTSNSNVTDYAMIAILGLIAFMVLQGK